MQVNQKALLWELEMQRALKKPREAHFGQKACNIQKTISQKTRGRFPKGSPYARPLNRHRNFSHLTRFDDYIHKIQIWKQSSWSAYGKNIS